jgi:glycosyltransferase involved in cell wall biosynthesis
MKYSIIIPAFDNVRFTSECVDQVFRNTQDFEVILVDNGSTDATPQLGNAWAQRYPEKFVYHRLPENRGFASAINVGTQLSHGSFVVWLNNDALVTPDWADHLSQCLEDAPRRLGLPRAGIVGPASNFVGGLQFVPNTTLPDLSRLDDFAREFHRANQKNWIFVSFLSGFCLMSRREALNDIGLLDADRFPIGGFEDNDFVIRALYKGWPAVIAGDTFVYHHGSKTIDLPPFMDQKRGVGNWQGFFEKYKDSSHKRLIACYRVKDAAPFLKKSLDSVARFTDGAVILDTGSKDHTIPIAKKHPIVRTVAAYQGPPNERIERNTVIELAQKLDADWIVSVDADEVFEDSFTAEQAQRLMNAPDPQICAYGFHFYTFWDKHNWRQDGIFGKMVGFRMFRNLPGLRITAGTAKGLHCGNIPTLPVDSRRFTSFRIKHLGYDSERLRQRKYKFYSTIDRNPDPLLVGSTSYKHLIEKSVSLRPWIESNGVALCMIVKDEAYNLFRLLGQQNGWNELTIVDTGSSDRTVEVAKAFGAKVYEIAWPDSFSVARNFAKDKATQPWILHLDPDELLDQNGQIKVRRLIEEPVDGYLTYVSNQHPDGRVTLSESIRLFRNLQDLRYSGYVHESFDVALQEKHQDLKFVTAPFNIIHQGYLKSPEAVQEKLDLYERLNRLQMENDPEDPRPYYNLALHFLNEDQVEEAERLLLLATKKSEGFYQPQKELGILHLRRAQQYFEKCLKNIPDSNPVKTALENMVQVIIGHLGQTDIRAGMATQKKEGSRD